MPFTYPDESAFPTAEGTNLDESPGLTKREYFAAAALQGILSQPNLMFDVNKYSGFTMGQVIAANAVEYADYTIAALNGEAPSNG
jgi:hypothetical protein